MVQKLTFAELERFFPDKPNGYVEITACNCHDDQKEIIGQLTALGVRIIEEPKSNIHDYAFVYGNEYFEISLSSLNNKQIIDLIKAQFKLV